MIIFEKAKSTEIIAGFSDVFYTNLVEGIQVGPKGGWNFASPGHVEIYGEVIESEEHLSPNKRQVIEIKKWPGGKHWYAYVSHQAVGSKCTHYYQAKDVAEEYVKSNT